LEEVVMASKFTELAVDCADPRRVAEFWAAVLDYKMTEENDDEVYIEGPEGSGPGLVFVKVPEGKSVKNRVHIDVNPSDRDQGEEVERLEALGATKIDIGQGDVKWVVMADIEGNEFCVLRTRVD
jgi:glyoxalase superfamily protein